MEFNFKFVNCLNIRYGKRNVPRESSFIISSNLLRYNDSTIHSQNNDDRYFHYMH